MNVTVGTPGVPEHTRSGSRWLGREAIEWTLRPEVIERLGVRSRDRDLLLLRAVASYARWDEAARAWVAWPAVDTLLRDCGWPAKAKAYRALASLADAALVRPTGERRGLGGSNVYELAIPPKSSHPDETTSTDGHGLKSSHHCPEVVSQLRDAKSEEERAFGSLPPNNRRESGDDGPAEGGPLSTGTASLDAELASQVRTILMERGFAEADVDEWVAGLGYCDARDALGATWDVASQVDRGERGLDNLLGRAFVAAHRRKVARELIAGGTA